MILPRLLFLFMLYHLSNCNSCPSGCNCTENAVFCMNCDLTTIPIFENLNNNPTIIDLSGNRLNDIGPDDLSFEKSYLVKEVYLNNSEVFDISFEAFDELENLQELYLGENLLNSVPANLIEDLPNMLLLEMSGNQFHSDMPIIRSVSLEVLSLANSKITKITAEALAHLPNLKMLLLQQNNIKHIDPEVFEQLPAKINFSVRLGFNPWECDCKTVELFEYLARKDFVDANADRHQCLSPTGSYVDIFRRNSMEVNYGLCGRGSSFWKRNSRIAEAEVDNEKERDSIGRNQDKPYSLVKEMDLDEVESINDKSIDNLEIVACERREKVILGVHLGMNELLIVLSSFVMGMFIGFSVFQCLSSNKHRRLETTDSTTKLIM